jgi:molybdopterin converting factor small subunit
MQVKIQLFQWLDQYVPDCDSKKVVLGQVEEGSTVKKLIEQLRIPIQEVGVVFINGNVSSPESVLKDGDKVTLSPPLSGG